VTNIAADPGEKVARVENLKEEAKGAQLGPPGYRRRIRIVPERGSVLALLEDDIHSMAVRLTHDGSRVLTVEPVLDRMPWTTCPGAATVLQDTFTGVPLCEVTARKDRKANCTHLHDLAVLAARYADSSAEVCFDIAASVPVGGRRVLSLARDGRPLLHWEEQDGELVSPPEVAGCSLLTVRDRISAMPAKQAEAARLLQWGSIVAHGRTMPIEAQSDASRIPPNCYTFQPERAATARRVGAVLDFSAGGDPPGERLRQRLGLAAC
jgi:hypothetical protein